MMEMIAQWENLYLDPQYNDNITREGVSSLGIVLQKPNRLQSFANWPNYHQVSADILSEAGLVYIGTGDGCRCYHCAGMLRNWETGDNSWSEHAKRYPKCGHVKLVKGQRFIDAVLKGETPEHDGESLETDGAPQEEDHLNSPAALSCLQMGYTNEYVTKAISEFIETNGHSHFEGQDLCEIICDLEDSEVGDQSLETDVDQANVADGGTYEPEKSVDEIVEENHRLKEIMVCKICLDNKADVIFLPCGHMVSCPLCAIALSTCPMCRTPVEGYVKAFLAAAT